MKIFVIMAVLISFTVHGKIMGRGLYNFLKARGHQVRMLGNCGATAGSWQVPGKIPYCYWEKDWNQKEIRHPWSPQGPRTTFKAPAFDELLKEDAHTVVVALISNYGGYTEPQHPVAEMRSMAQKIIDSGKQCVWVSTPARNHPQSRSAAVLDEWVKAAVSDLCEVILPSPSMNYPSDQGDGIHYWPIFNGDRFDQQIKLWTKLVGTRIHEHKN